MELTLKRLLEQAEFTESRKGYDRDEVEDFLDRAVAMATKVEAKLTETIEQAKSAPVAGRSAAEFEAEVERRVAARLADTPMPTAPSEDEMADQVRRTIVLAQRTADAAISEARNDANKLLADAKERAASINADLDARSEAAHADLAAEIGAERAAAQERLASEISELEDARDALREDIKVLERHVEEQRNQLRSTVGELQRLLDDPAGFRLRPTPALIDPEVPDLPGLPGRPGSEPPAPDEPGPAESFGFASAGAPAPPGFAAPSAPDQGEPLVEELPVQAEPADPAFGGEHAFEEVDHAQPGLNHPLESGPPTAPFSTADLDQAGVHPAPPPPPRGGRHDAEDEDAFLAELRKAMADDEPLGPRETAEQTTEDLFGDDRRAWRFGKRR